MSSDVSIRVEETIENYSFPINNLIRDGFITKVDYFYKK
jgi:hypothetical protein